MASIYGDLVKITTSGASDQTVSKEKLTVKGVQASHKMAETDLKNMDQYKSVITKVGRAKQVDPALIAGIISRESRAGLLLKNGWGDSGNGFGLMQVDKRSHTPRGAWNSEEHLTQATEILIDFVKKIQVKFPSWPKEHQLKGGIAAYNFGDKNVKTYENMDKGTHRDDYSSDVVARAQWYKRHGY